MTWTRLTAFGCVAVLCVGCEQNAANDKRESSNQPSSQSDSVGTSGDRDREKGQSPTAQPGSAQPGSAQPGSAQPGSADVKEFVNRAAMINTAEVQLGRLADERAQNREVKQFAQTMVRDHTKAEKELQQAVSSHGVQSPSKLDAEHEALMTKLRDMRGAEFDREYMKAMVEGHSAARDLLRMRARGGQSHSGATGTAGQAQPGQTAGQAQPGQTTGQAQSGRTGTASTPSAAGGDTRTQPKGTAGGAITGGDPNTQLEPAVEQWATKTLPVVEQHLKLAEQLDRKLEATSTTGSAGSRGGAKGERGTSGGDTTAAPGSKPSDRKPSGK